MASSGGFIGKMTSDLFVQLETAHFSFLSEQNHLFLEIQQLFKLFDMCLKLGPKLNTKLRQPG